MTMKITAITVSVCAVLLYVLAMLFPNDPYFDLISSNAVTSIFRLIIAAMLVHLAFKKKFRTVYAPAATGFLAILMVAFGLAGIAVPSLTYSLFSYIKPMDYIFMIETGVFFAIASISYERGTKRFPRLSRPRNTQLRLFSPNNAT